MKNISIELSEFPGIYKVYYGDLQPLYVSQNGDFFIYGDMFNISSDGIINLTDKDILQKRKLLMQEITNEELISFKAKNELFTVTVFTDVDCGYCRKLHDEITTYNEAGITVNYAAFPRSGIGTETFSKMVGAWCSNNPKESITKLKNGKKLKLSFCDSQPVAKHYAIGNKIGVTGTPAIVSSTTARWPYLFAKKRSAMNLKNFVIDKANASEVLVIALSINSLI